MTKRKTTKTMSGYQSGGPLLDDLLPRSTTYVQPRPLRQVDYGQANTTLMNSLANKLKTVKDPKQRKVIVDSIKTVAASNDKMYSQGYAEGGFLSDLSGILGSVGSIAGPVGAIAGLASSVAPVIGKLLSGPDHTIVSGSPGNYQSGGPVGSVLGNMSTVTQEDYANRGKTNTPTKYRGTESSGRGILAMGSEGNEVSLLQSFLKDKGFNPGEIDGKYGKKTKEAVRQYQKWFNDNAKKQQSYIREDGTAELIGKDGKRILEDGIVGDQTRSALMYREQPEPKKKQTYTGVEIVDPPVMDTPDIIFDQAQDPTTWLNPFIMASMLTPAGAAEATLAGAAETGVASNLTRLGLKEAFKQGARNIPRGMTSPGNPGPRAFAPKTPSSYGTTIGYASGGDVPLSSTSFQVDGDPNVVDSEHYQIGSRNIKLDDKEVYKQGQSGGYVYSNRLKPTGSKDSFAKIAAAQERKLKQAEKILQRNPNDTIAANTIDKLNMSMASLAGEQEIVASEKGYRQPLGDATTGQIPPKGMQSGGPILPEEGKPFMHLGADNYYDPYNSRYLQRSMFTGKYDVLNAPPEARRSINSTPNTPMFGPAYRTADDNIYSNTDDRVFNITQHLSQYGGQPAASPLGPVAPQQQRAPGQADISTIPDQELLGVYNSQLEYGIEDPIKLQELQRRGLLRQQDPSTIPSEELLGVYNDEQGLGVQDKIRRDELLKRGLIKPGVGGNGKRAASQGTEKAKPSTLPLWLTQSRDFMKQVDDTTPTSDRPELTTPPAIDMSYTADQRAGMVDTPEGVSSEQPYMEPGLNPGTLAGDAGKAGNDGDKPYKTPYTFGDALQTVSALSKFGQLIGGPEKEKVYSNNAPITQETYDPTNALYQNQRQLQNTYNQLSNLPSLNMSRAIGTNLYGQSINQENNIRSQYDKMNQGARSQYQERLGARRSENLRYRMAADQLNAANRGAYNNAVSNAFDSLSNLGQNFNQKSQSDAAISLLRDTYKDVFPRFEQILMQQGLFK